MKTQIIQDSKGLPAGVFIPIQDWENIKMNYPDIENLNEELPQWQKDILDSRLADMNEPDQLESIEALFKILDE